MIQRPVVWLSINKTNIDERMFTMVKCLHFIDNTSTSNLCIQLLLSNLFAHAFVFYCVYREILYGLNSNSSNNIMATSLFVFDSRESYRYIFPTNHLHGYSIILYGYLFTCYGYNYLMIIHKYRTQKYFN